LRGREALQPARQDAGRHEAGRRDDQRGEEA